MADFASIVMVCYRKGANNREEMFRTSLSSLFANTSYPFELILVDNTQVNKPLGYARNEGLIKASGKYTVITDDDILFKPSWLKECVEMVELGDRFFATPVHQPRVKRWELEPFKGYRRNTRTGSNCMVGRTKDFLGLGPFLDLPVNRVGVEYADRVVKRGFSFLITKFPLAEDMGFRKHSYE
jgi:glycosyltransferase involved in cell wall biosynthesis